MSLSSYIIQIPRTIAENAQYGTGDIARNKNALYATRVEDRFGNWVTYAYTNASNQPIKLSAINASDGRSLSFQYNANNVIASVSTGSRTWNYQYTGAYLTGVTQPDGGQWSIAFADLSKADINYLSGDDPQWRSCFRDGPLDTQYSVYTGTITHPSGAVGTFTVAPAVHGRSNVPAICMNFISSTDSSNNFYNDTTNDFALFPFKWHSISLTSKTIAGPGLPTQTWYFSYTAGASWVLRRPSTDADLQSRRHTGDGQGRQQQRHIPEQLVSGHSQIHSAPAHARSPCRRDRIGSGRRQRLDHLDHR